MSETMSNSQDETVIVFGIVCILHRYSDYTKWFYDFTGVNKVRAIMGAL